MTLGPLIVACASAQAAQVEPTSCRQGLRRIVNLAADLDCGDATSGSLHGLAPRSGSKRGTGFDWTDGSSWDVCEFD